MRRYFVILEKELMGKYVVRQKMSPSSITVSIDERGTDVLKKILIA